MRPAEEIEAFAKLIDEGQSVEHVAACFGVPPLLVARRMKLARISALFFMVLLLAVQSQMYWAIGGSSDLDKPPRWNYFLQRYSCVTVVSRQMNLPMVRQTDFSVPERSAPL